MGIPDVIHFDEEKYTKKINGFAENGEYYEIQKRDIAKGRQITGANTKMIVTGLAGVPTGGMSLVGTVFGWRQRRIACKKLRIIHKVMKAYSIPLHEESKRDKVIPIMAQILGLGIGWGLDLGVSDVISAGANEVATLGYTWVPTPSVEQSISAAVNHPEEFIEGMLQGGQAEIAQAVSPFESGSMAANSAQATITSALPQQSTAAFVDGAVAGHSMLLEGEQFNASLLLQQVVISAGDKTAQHTLKKGGLPNDSRPPIQPADSGYGSIGETSSNPSTPPALDHGDPAVSPFGKPLDHQSGNGHLVPA